MKKIGLLMVLLLSISLVSALDWSDQLVSYWSLNESSGTSFLDSVSGNHNGTLYHPGNTWVNGKLANALELNDTSVEPYGLVNNSDDFMCLSECSINLWVYSNWTSGRGTNNLLNYWVGNKGWYIQDQAADQLVFGVGDSNTGINPTIVNRWYMLTAIYNGTDALLYVNGTLVNSTIVPSQTIQSGSNLGVGYSAAASGEFFFGTLDEIAYFNRTLNITEIETLYNSNTGLPYLGQQYSLNINLTYPTNDLIISATSLNFTANYSMVNLNLTNITYNIFNYPTYSTYNITTIELTGEFYNESNVNFSFSQLTNYIFNIKACGILFDNSHYCQNSEYRIFTITSYLELNNTFNNSVIETSGQYFEIALKPNPLISSVNGVNGLLWYNGTSYSSTIKDLDNGIYTVSNLIDIPLSEKDESNKSFYWEFNFIQSSGVRQNENSSSYSQLVNITYLSPCNDTLDTEYLNISTRNVKNITELLNSTFKSTWEYYVKGGSGTIFKTFTYENLTEINNNYRFCAMPNISLITSSIIEINKDDYSQNNHYLINEEINNNSENLNLYLLNHTLATLTEINVKDYSQTPQENVYIQIQKYDSGTDTFHTVSMARTNFEGSDISYLEWYDTFYKYVLIKSGKIVLTTNTTKVYGTPVSLEIPNSFSFNYDKFGDVSYSLTFNNLTNNFILTFSKTTGGITEGCLRVVKRTTKNDTIICNLCESSSSATLYCNIGSYGNGTFLAHFYGTGSLGSVESLQIFIGVVNEIYEVIGNLDGTIYAIFISLIVMLIFFVSPALGVIGLLLGMLAGMALGFQPLNYMEFIGITIVGLIVVSILNK